MPRTKRLHKPMALIGRARAWWHPESRQHTNGREEQGFTLVELMVVIAIIGLAGAAVLLTARTNSDPAREAADGLALRLAAARDRAIITGQPQGLWIAPSGYGEEERADGRWQAPAENHHRSWPRGVRLDAASAGTLHIRFDALGLPEQTLELGLSSGGQRRRVLIDAGGEVKVAGGRSG